MRIKETPGTYRSKLLLVEDNYDMAQYLEEVLFEDYSVMKAKDGEEGFRHALEMNPDVVISDVMMPVMDGYEFCKKMKTDIRTSHIPVILLTAKTMHEDKISKLSGMSRKHLNNKIKSLTKQTTNELIRGFRLRKAAYLLSEKGISVSKTCYQVGFNNLSYFSKCFADFYGMRPSEYCR